MANATADVPPARANHRAVMIDEIRMLMFGGEAYASFLGTKVATFNDTWILNLGSVFFFFFFFFFFSVCLFSAFLPNNHNTIDTRTWSKPVVTILPNIEEVEVYVPQSAPVAAPPVAEPAAGPTEPAAGPVVEPAAPDSTVLLNITTYPVLRPRAGHSLHTVFDNIANRTKVLMFFGQFDDNSVTNEVWEFDDGA
jgi:hypothetical protein